MIDRKMTSWGSEIGTCSIFNVPPNISKDSRFLDSCHVLLSLVVSFADSALFQLETWQDVQKFFFYSEHPKHSRAGKADLVLVSQCSLHIQFGRFCWK